MHVNTSKGSSLLSARLGFQGRSDQRGPMSLGATEGQAGLGGGAGRLEQKSVK